jgi:V-type H+-transporting ATPase subunit a
MSVRQCIIYAVAFERILFHATRDNVFFRQIAVENPITNPISGEKVLTYVPPV